MKEAVASVTTEKIPCVIHKNCTGKKFTCECNVTDGLVVHNKHYVYRGDCGKCLSIALARTEHGKPVDGTRPEIEKLVEEFKRQLRVKVPSMYQPDIERLEAFVSGNLTPGMMGLISGRYGCVVRDLVSKYHLLVRHAKESQ